MRGLMLNLRAKGIDVQILTSFGVHDPLEMGSEACRAKTDFLRQWYGDLFKDGTISQSNGVANSRVKQNCATPDSVLLDDYDRNIEQWRAAGGTGFLYREYEHDEVFKKVYKWLESR